MFVHVHIYFTHNAIIHANIDVNDQRGTTKRRNSNTQFPKQHVHHPVIMFVCTCTGTSCVKTCCLSCYIHVSTCVYTCTCTRLLRHSDRGKERQFKATLHNTRPETTFSKKKLHSGGTRTHVSHILGVMHVLGSACFFIGYSFHHTCVTSQRPAKQLYQHFL